MESLLSVRVLGIVVFFLVPLIDIAVEGRCALNEPPSNTLISRAIVSATLDADTIKSSAECSIEQQFVLDILENECKDYIPSIEDSPIYLWPKDRWEAGERMSACLYHYIFLAYPNAPNGVSTVGYKNGDGDFYIGPYPNVTESIESEPLPPLDTELVLGDKSPVEFPPLFEQATISFFERVQEEVSCFGEGQASDALAIPDPLAPVVGQSKAKNQEIIPIQKLYQAVDIVTQQYARCSYQNILSPDDIQNCTVETTEKLHWLPGSFFIYSGTPICNSEVWSYTSVSLSVFLDLLYTAILYFLRQKFDIGANSSFSWLMLLIRLASNLGEPFIQAVILQRSSFAPTAGFVIAAMEFLQPTAMPLIAAYAGWYFGKGEAVLVFITDAMVSLAGMSFLALLNWDHLMQVTKSYGENLVPSKLVLLPVSFYLAIGPWVVIYVCFVLISWILTFVIAWGLFRLCYAGDARVMNRSILFLLYWAVCLLFVAMTPIWAVWELVWQIRKQVRKRTQAWKEMTEVQREEKGVFPLARYFKKKYKNEFGEKSWKRMLVFWTVIMLGIVSHVGKWMLMATLLSFADDAYCPSDFVKATGIGVGYKIGVLGLGVVLRFFGLA